MEINMNSKPFSAQIRLQSEAVTIDLQGEIDAFAEAELNAAYVAAEAHNPSRVMLNFSAVDYINSTGIALIVGLLARARKAHRELVVFGLSDHYLEIFEITRLVDFMTIYADEASALQSA
jgi:anti-sigma B factor antagonist